MRIKMLLPLAGLMLPLCAFSQGVNDITVSGRDSRYNALRYAASFLTIAPDSRASGMGDLGVATSPDAYSTAWNVGKLANIESGMGLALGYTPWLQKLVKDIDLAYLTGYYRIDENQVIGGALRYFSLGEMIFRDNNGIETMVFNPNEFSLDGSYSRRLGESFSMGLSARYIYSNLAGNYTSGGETMNPAHAFAVDLGAYYHTKVRLGDYPSTITAGLSISNIGSKITYSANNKNFLPMNLRLGGGLLANLDQYNSLGIYLDLNKLLLPTPKIYADGDSLTYWSSQGISVASAIFKSFTDGNYQGSVFKEEMQEINLSIGAEYIYDKKFFVRTGFFYEHERKGGRKYLTAGAGLKLNVFGLDISYLIPTVPGGHPLAQTLRFSLVLDIGAMGD